MPRSVRARFRLHKLGKSPGRSNSTKRVAARRQVEAVPYGSPRRVVAAHAAAGQKVIPRKVLGAFFVAAAAPQLDRVGLGRTHANRRRLVSDPGNGPTSPVQGGLQSHTALEKTHRREEHLRRASLCGGRKETTPARLSRFQARLPSAAEPARKTHASGARGRLSPPTSSTPDIQDGYSRAPKNTGSHRPAPKSRENVHWRPGRGGARNCRRRLSRRRIRTYKCCECSRTACGSF